MTSIAMLKIVVMLCTTSLDSTTARISKELCVKEYIKCMDKKGQGGELLNFKACVKEKH